MDNLQSLSAVMGEEKAKKVLKLASNYDKYVDKFRKEMNALLDPSGFEVKTGIVFTQKEIPKKSE
jgi:hypothetical protein